MKKVIHLYRRNVIEPIRETENLYWVLVMGGIVWTILHMFKYSLMAVIVTGFSIIGVLLLTCVVLLGQILKKMNNGRS